MKVSPDGVTFSTADSDNAYHYSDIDLRDFPMTSTFYIVFDAEMSSNEDYWFLDAIGITGVR